MESKIVYRDAAGRDIRLPKEVYYRCLWTVRDSGRLEKLTALLAQDPGRREEGTSHEYQAGGASNKEHEHEDSVVSDDVLHRAAGELRCIRTALGRVPEVYREGLLDNICRKVPFEDFAHPNTWKRWKLVFMYELAKELRLI